MTGGADALGAERRVTRVEASSGWRALGLRALWEHRELLFFFIWRDVKVRYKQTVFGAGWAVLQPLLLMTIFAIFLGKLARVPSDGLPYPIFAYAALVPWTLFSQSLTSSAMSLVENGPLVSKVYFPRLALPVAATGSFLIDFVIASGLLVAMMAYYGIAPTANVVWIPAFTLLAIAAAMAVGIGLAALNVRYRDVRYALTFLAQAWMFATPIAYPSSLVPERFRAIYGLNPMAGVVDGFRWALLGQRLASVSLLVVSASVTVVLLLVAVVYFRRMERTFADEI